MKTPTKKQLASIKHLISRGIRASYKKQKAVFDKYPKEYELAKKLAKN